MPERFKVVCIPCKALYKLYFKVHRLLCPHQTDERGLLICQSDGRLPTRVLQ